MSEKDRSLEFGTYCEPAQVSEYLEALARQLRVGQARLVLGTDAIDLYFDTNVKFELQAKVKEEKGKSSLEIGLFWRRARPAGRFGLVIDEVQASVPEGREDASGGEVADETSDAAVTSSGDYSSELQVSDAAIAEPDVEPEVPSPATESPLARRYLHGAVTGKPVLA